MINFKAIVHNWHQDQKLKDLNILDYANKVLWPDGMRKLTINEKNKLNDTFKKYEKAAAKNIVYKTA